MEIMIFDAPGAHDNLLPLTYTRPVGALRVGMSTIAEKWERLTGCSYGWKTEDYLSPLFRSVTQPEQALWVNGSVIPDRDLADAVMALEKNSQLWHDDMLLAAWGGCTPCDACSRVMYSKDVMSINNVYDIFILNGDALRLDYEAVDRSDNVAPHKSVTVIGPEENLYIHPTAQVLGCIINVSAGPVYVGPNATVMEGSTLRGPVAVCEHASVNMGTKIYPDTTIGPWCKVGGELNNVVMQAYSNKAHDGFLGNAVVGEWCNLGAGCVASNLKNDYNKIKLWNYPAHRFLPTGLQFCGLIMGDHSKAGINTMFNTATVVGVGVNIHGTGFPRNFVASFSEGGAGGFSDVPMSKFFDIAERVMARRGKTMGADERAMFEHIRRTAENYK